MNESDTANGDNPPPTPTDAPNVVALSGQSQTVPIGFNADVRGTAAAETLQVLSNTNVTFGGNDGDEIEFVQPISAYTISASGNGISVSNGETKASLSLNGAVDLAFADGSATAQIQPTDAGFGVFLGEQRVGDTFDPGAVTLDTSDVSAIADQEGSDSGGSFPDLPSEGGPQPVSAGTGASENINGNQNATISGNGGDDRYILQTDSNAELTIDDFENGDQLFFTVDQLNDINVNNDVFGDGRVTLSAGQAAVTLTNLTESADQQIFDNASFEEQFGDRGIGISGDGGEDTGFPAVPSEGGPQPVSAGTGASENLDGNQDTTISGNGGQDRFIVDPEEDTSLTVDDFASGDQIFFNVDQLRDVSITNGGFNDGRITLGVGEAAVTLTNLAESVDQQIFNAASFEEQFGSRGIGIIDDAGGDPASGDDNDTGTAGDNLPVLPSEGGPQPVDAGTNDDDNIDGNQNSTISGNGGLDRFIIDPEDSASVTIDDFDTGDQLFFQGGLTDGDVGVTNPSFTDGVVQLSGGETEVTLTSIGSADQQIFSASQFVETFGQDALGFA